MINTTQPTDLCTPKPGKACRHPMAFEGTLGVLTTKPQQKQVTADHRDHAHANEHSSGRVTT